MMQAEAAINGELPQLPLIIIAMAHRASIVAGL